MVTVPAARCEHPSADGRATSAGRAAAVCATALLGTGDTSTGLVVAGACSRRPRSRRLTADLPAPLARAREAADDPHERRLAGTVRPDEPEYLARLDAQRHPTQRLYPPVALDEVRDDEGGRRHVPWKQ